VVGGFFAYGYVARHSKPPAEQERESAIPVRTAKVRRGAIELAISLTGEVKAVSSVEVKPKISGRLERLALDDGSPVVEGTRVKAGQVIAVLEHKDLEAQVAQANAAIETAKAGITSANVNLKDKQREKLRMENLFKQGSATEKQRDAALADYDRAAASLEQAGAQLAQAQAALQLAEVTLQEAFLRAPMDAVVSEKFVDPGAMVGPATALVCIMPMVELKFLMGVPGPFVPRIVPGRTSVEIKVDAYPGREFPSRIANVYPTMDPATRTATVEIRIRNSTDDAGRYLLRPGMYATGHLVLEKKDNAVVVRADALVRHLNEYYAFVVSDGVARTRSVQLGLRSGEDVEIIKGLSEGEELVVSGQHKLTDATPVERAGDTGETGGTR